MADTIQEVLQAFARGELVVVTMTTTGRARAI